MFNCLNAPEVKEGEELSVLGGGGGGGEDHWLLEVFQLAGWSEG